MNNFPTSIDFYHRIKHDLTINSSKIKITYLDSMKKKYIDTEFSKWTFIEDGGDIPMHRIYYYKYKDIIIWDREKKILNLNPIYEDVMIKLPNTFTILTWNVLNQKTVLNKKHEQKRVELLIEQLKIFILMFDVLCLQEVNKNIIDILKNDTSLSIYNFIHTDLKTNDNIVFITKYEIRNVTNVVLSSEKEFLMVKFETESFKEINIYGVHLTSDTQTNSSHKRLEQINKIYELINPCSNPNSANTANIICGDFNEQNSTHVLLNEIMTDSFFIFNGDFDNETTQTNFYTYDPNSNELAYQNSTSKLPFRYDKIFFSSQIKPINEINIWSQIKVSDHYPVSTTFELIDSVESTESVGINFKNYIQDKKITSSGLFIVVPSHADDYLEMQKIRKELDENYDKWMPHLSIHLGWIDEFEFNDWIKNNLNQIQNINTFEIILDKVDFLTHDSSWTLVLKPNDICNNNILNVFRLFGSDKEPHLTLGKFKDENKLRSKIKFVKDKKLSVKFNFDMLHLVSKKYSPYGLVSNIISLNSAESLNNFGQNNQTKDDIEYVVKQIFPNIKIYIGGSSIYSLNNIELDKQIQQSDIDLLIVGSYEENKFYDKLNKYFQTNGYFIHSKNVSNKFMHFLRTIHHVYGNIDIHYLDIGVTVLDDPTNIINTTFNINNITSEQKIKSSIYWDNAWINDYVETNNIKHIFMQGLYEIKNLFKTSHIYGQEYCYIGGISIAILICYYIKTNKCTEWNTNEFCNFYSSFNFAYPISLTNDYASTKNKDPHIFMRVIGPISQYNTSRTLTKTTFNAIKYHLNNNFLNKLSDTNNYELSFFIETYNYYNLDEIKSFVRSIFLKIITHIEKNTGPEQIFMPYSNDSENNYLNMCEYKFVWTFGFTFNPLSVINIFDDIKNKIINLYQHSSAYYVITKK
jgi:endonuclease/exonuclease/phosphatase family metal-dependent hydrolase